MGICFLKGAIMAKFIVQMGFYAGFFALFSANIKIAKWLDVHERAKKETSVVMDGHKCDCW